MKHRTFVIVASYPPSVINFRGDLIREILALEFNVIVVIPENTNENDIVKIREIGVTCYTVPMLPAGLNFINDLKTLFSLRKLFNYLKPQYVLMYTIKPIVWGSLAATKNSDIFISSLITGLGFAFTEPVGVRQKFIRKIIILLYRAALKRNKLVFFQNQDDLKLLLSLKIISSSVRTKVVNGSGVNTKFFSYRPQVTTPIRFLMIARLLKNKGLLEYLQAAEVIKQKYPLVEFHLVGWFDDNPSVIAAHELEPYEKNKTVIFHGKLSDVRDVIAQSSVYVLPSYREGLPRSVLEAMAMGRPIITTNVPGCRETVVPGYNGFIIEPKSVDELVVAMSEFINNPSLIGTMGKNSRQLVIDKFDVDKINNEMLYELGLQIN